jgi:lipid-A-disaccharide synthase
VKYYIIAGEASGDLHGSNLIREIAKLDVEAEYRCWGGDLMEAAGGAIIKHYRDLAFMGFIEVIKNLRTIFKNLSFCKEDIERYNPDVLLLIDYPGFNLRIAQWAKQKGLKIIYYISPQVWAWKEGRVKMIKKVVDKMLVILPFEKGFYEDKWDYKVVYVGHPLVEVVEQYNSQQEELVVYSAKEENSQKAIIALLPGSRSQEIAVKLPIMLEASKNFPQYRFIIAQAPGQPQAFYQQFIQGFVNIELAKSGQAYALLSRSKAALVTSGTATLETALFGVPEVVCYKGSAVSYHIAKRLIKIKYISLVNLIMDKSVVKELIQHNLTIENITRELNDILHNPQRIEQLNKDYSDLKNLLKQGGNASARAAQEVIGFMQKST